MKRRVIGNPLGKALKIHVVTDIHIDYTVNGDPNAPGAIRETRKYFYDAANRLQQFRIAANNANSDLVLCLGDMVDAYADENWALFVPEWNAVTRPKELVIGNHDLANGTYEDVVAKLGYNTRPVVAGSVFNRSFSVSNGFITARIIIFDSQIDTSGVHTNQGTGNLQPDALAWIESELNGAPEDVILLCSHQGPHSQYFNSSAESLNDIVQTFLAANKHKRIYHLYGHNHGVYNAVSSFKFGTNYPGFLNPAILEYADPKYIVYYVLPNGSLKVMPFSVY